MPSTPPYLNYMIAGYAVIFTVMIVYIASLFVRTRNLQQDMQTLRELEEQEPAPSDQLRRGLL